MLKVLNTKKLTTWGELNSENIKNLSPSEIMKLPLIKERDTNIKSLPKVTFDNDQFLYSVEKDSPLLDSTTIQCIDYFNTLGYSRTFTHSANILNHVLNILKPADAEGLIMSLIDIPNNKRNTILNKNRQYYLGLISKNPGGKVKDNLLFFKKLNSLFKKLDITKSNINDPVMKGIKETCDSAEGVSTKKYRFSEDESCTIESAVNIVTNVIIYKLILFLGSRESNVTIPDDLTKIDITHLEQRSLFMAIDKILNLKAFKMDGGNLLANLSMNFIGVAYSVVSCMCSIVRSATPYKEFINEISEYNFFDENMKETRNGQEDQFIKGLINITIIKSLNTTHKLLTGEDISILGNKFLELVENFLAETEDIISEEAQLMSKFVNTKNTEIDVLLEQLRDKEDLIDNLQKALSNKLKGKLCLVIGDTNRRVNYEEIINKYGGKFEFFDPYETPSGSVMKTLIGKADIIFTITAFNKHIVHNIIESKDKKEVYKVEIAGMKALEETILYKV